MYSSEHFKEKNDKLTEISDMKIHTPIELEELLEKAGYNNIRIDLIDEKNWLCCICEK